MATMNISYSQIAVFSADVSDPFNDWTDEHVAQGFSWRPESVSFKTIEEAGSMDFEVNTTTSFEPATSSAVRVIRVPFRVSERGEVEVASIGDGVAFELAPGLYELTFEHGREESSGMWCRFYFKPSYKEVRAEIIKVDDQLSPPEELVMTTVPAHG